MTLLGAAAAAGLSNGGPNLVVLKARLDPPANTSPNWYRTRS